MDRENSFYHCTSEWHLAQLDGKGSLHALTLYTFSLRLAKKSGVFFCSLPRLAEYFEKDQRTIRKAKDCLVHTGFWEVLGGVYGGESAARYKPLIHDDWRKKHGTTKCVQRLDMPWASEPLDALGQGMYAASGGRYTPYTNFLKGLRGLGHSDAALLVHFKAFAATQQPNGRRFAKGFTADFFKYLKNQPLACGDPSHPMHSQTASDVRA